MTARGFTLIEVLVALAVIAIAVVALAGSGTRALDAQYEIEQRSAALWVAANRIAEVALEQPVGPGPRSGISSMAGGQWHWRMNVQPAPGGDLWRVDVAVGSDAEADLVTHVGFLPR
ncbi:MAG: type II secretion system minor pseudopilin GspI [Wenzhouxiangellaceae bacterium]|nr:type II secretion system minor pseudopilin GspI [Wenzhouxiangellaceae bacterium]